VKGGILGDMGTIPGRMTINAGGGAGAVTSAGILYLQGALDRSTGGMARTSENS